MNIKQHIPNAITCCNLVCGCVGITQLFEGDIAFASWMIFAACIFDFFDGFVARLLHVSSPIGKELDSLADVVTFGVLPGLIMFKLMSFNVESQTFGTPWYTWLGLMVPVFSALRLAKFNLDTRQSDSFIGVPTPANALLLGSLPLILQEESVIPYIIGNVGTLHILFATLSVVCSLLLVAELPLIALKFKDFSWKNNSIRFIFLGLSFLFIVIFQIIALPLIIALYIGMSVVNNVLMKQNS